MEAGHIKGILRVRPNVQDIPTDRLTVVDSGEGATVLVRKRGGSTGDLLKFNFWRALEGATQEETYKTVGAPLVNAALEGYNATILAYGQTGSGKTYTMLGPEDYNIGDPDFKGIMPRALDHVFGELRRGKFVTWTVKLTYIEIYNESFRDLLEPRATDISLADSNPRGNGTISLRGVQHVEIQSVTEALHYLRKGQVGRHVGSHTMNDRSSRSHTVLTLWLDTTDDRNVNLKSKLNLIDLAGSERIWKTGAVGHVAREASYINKSLTSLAMVVNELKKKMPHVSYRNSKLTHFLKDSLGGNCKTLLIANVWGDERYMDETVATCRFADEIQKVEVHAAKNNGIECIQGHLFRLDAPILKYIDQVTARRVAQEKAKLIRELKRRGHLALRGMEDLGELELGEDDCEELETLRARVKELEAIQAMLNVEGERQPGNWDNDLNVKETEQLRMRVRELELERERVGLERKRDAQRDAVLTERGMSLMAEMESLRQRVKELQEARSLSTEEVEELLKVRQRVLDIASATPGALGLDGLDGSDKLLLDPAARRAGMGRLASVSEESEANETRLAADGSLAAGPGMEQEVEKLHELRKRLKKLQKMGSIDDDGLLELLDLRDKILNGQLKDDDSASGVVDGSRFVPYRKKHGAIGAGTMTTMPDEDGDAMSVASRSPENGYQRMEMTRSLSTEREIQMLRAENEHMRNALESYAELPPFSSSAVANGFEHAYMETMGPDASISYTHDQDVWPLQQRTGESATSAGRLKSRLGRRLSKAFTWRKRDKPNKFLMDYQTNEDEDVPNIVILNSLTHDQLLELLKARNAQGSEAGEPDAETGSQYGRPQSVRSMASSGMDTSTTIGMDAREAEHEGSIRDLEVV
ncbi:unnamed protein product [Ostreobium quekettii]|uniref:Kinesin-like protein n=1 Tax=Ostreobium quekettii TaxID=121088 RepID=A0A8S1JF02_9CHLO|nr:unnamed protein product [Ostreobium quekettii]|eukprot:evm.model.scf_316.3 EVM.evm.TU.scf_316.3   scf_316:62293-73925(-)